MFDEPKKIVVGRIADVGQLMQMVGSFANAVEARLRHLEAE